MTLKQEVAGNNYLISCATKILTIYKLPRLIEYLSIHALCGVRAIWYRLQYKAITVGLFNNSGAHL